MQGSGSSLDWGASMLWSGQLVVGDDNEVGSSLGYTTNKSNHYIERLGHEGDKVEVLSWRYKVEVDT